MSSAQNRSAITALIARTEQQDVQALAKLLTALERQGPSVLGENPELLQTTKQAFRFGITGPPGAGKSTLVSQLIKHLRALGLRVGVIAVDPSSPFSKGAVLGDRIRYVDHFEDPGVFIRSLATRGSLGGLSSSAYLMVRAFDLAGFDFVLLETVGVGQTELEVINVADFVSVVLVPESGDGIQAMKAGLLEIADLFIVNKSDRPGAASFQRELEAAVEMGMREGLRGGLHQVEVTATTALTGAGVDQVIQKITAARAADEWKKARVLQSRLQAEARALLRDRFEREIARQTAHIQTPHDVADLFAEKIPTGDS